MALITTLSRLVDRLGGSLTRYACTITDDGRGQDIFTYDGTGESIKAIPSDSLSKQFIYNTFGIQDQNSSAFIFKGDADITINDKINYDSTDFIISKIDKINFKGTFVVKIVELNDYV